jgi:hypothetical protein
VTHACTSLAGLDGEFVVDGSSSAGGTAGGSGGATGSGGAGGSSTSGVATGTTGGGGEGGSMGVGGGGTGGQGGSPVFCGNGIIDSVEECDDTTHGGEDPCNNCLVECPAGGLEEPTTHHCYIVEKNNVPWSIAMDNCLQVGFHLATITSAQEANFVQSLNERDDLWLGGFYQSGNWMWTTGEPWGFTNWENGQPSNPITQACLTVTAVTHEWNDDTCNDGYGYMCEWAPPGM